MFSSLRRLVGAIKITEDQTTVTVEGVPADLISRDISRLWSTGRINQFMFSRIGRNSFSFPKFFAPDVHFALQRLSEEKGMRTRKGALLHVIQALQEESWLKQINEEHPSILDYSQLSKLNVKMLEHQHNFLDIYNERVPKYNLHGYLLAADPGTGKTLNGLALSLCLKADFVFITCPKNAVHRVWQATIRERFVEPQTVWVAADGVPYKGEKYIIAHYEGLPKALEVARSHTHGKVVNILDESHNLNEFTSQRSKNFDELCKVTHCEHVLWMSGTPLKAMAYESIPLLRTVDPLFTSDAEERYKKIFGRDVGRAVDILRNRLGLVSYKVSAAQTITNETHTKEVKVKIPHGQDYTLDAIRTEMSDFITDRLAYYRDHMGRYTKLYKEALDLHEATLDSSEQKREFSKYKSAIALIRKGYDPIAHKEEATFCNQYELKSIIPSLPTKEWRDDFKDCRSVIKYVDLKVTGEALGRVLGKKRAQCHVEMIPEIHLETYVKEAATKTVIFTSYVEVVKAAASYLKGKGLETLEVYGETNANINSIISRFEKDEKCQVLLATYQSLSTAVPLVMASTAIFLNQPFREFEMKQAKARLDRLGQSSPVTFVNVLLDTGHEPNISTRSQDILEWSKAMVSAMLGDEDSEPAVNRTLDNYYSQSSQESYSCASNVFDLTFESFFWQYAK